jgi:hypothetical protein
MPILLFWMLKVGFMVGCFGFLGLTK